MGEALFGGTLGQVLALVGAMWAAVCAVKGQRLIARSLHSPGHTDQSRWMIRGIRYWILAAGLLSFAGAFFSGQLRWFLFGCVFLGEELVETGIMLFALRKNRAHPQERP